MQSDGPSQGKATGEPMAGQGNGDPPAALLKDILRQYRFPVVGTFSSK